jgi:hypothetical protein
MQIILLVPTLPIVGLLIVAAARLIVELGKLSVMKKIGDSLV